MGIGCWVKTPGDLLLSHDMAKKAVQYRYLLGGCLLLDMEEHKTENGISLYETLEQLTDALKTGKKESMELCLARMEEEIKGAFVDKKPCVHVSSANCPCHRECV